MRTMIRYRLYKIYFLLCAVLITQTAIAQDTRLSKSIDRTFAVSGDLNLEITNKYGNVIVESWEREEVSLKIEILAFGKDESAAEKLMDRVEFDFKHSDDFLEVESVFDRKKSFFKDLINAVGDYSANLMSKHKLKVNYELTIPQNASSISIDNRFGDIHLGDLNGRINIALSHGNLRANKVEEYSRMSINYGNVKIDQVDEINMTLKGAELDLKQAIKLDLKSSSSSIIAERVLMLDIESTNDKIEIDEVGNISGSASFTEMLIEHLNEECRLNQSYGGMEIKNIHEQFRTIRLTGKSTDYELHFSNRSNFEARIYARDDKLSITEYRGQKEKRYMDEKSKFVQITGLFGTDQTDSKLTIDAQNGHVNIGFKEILPETYNK